MITNADITIFNRRYMDEEKTERYVPTQIHDVSFYSKKSVAGGDQELEGKNTYTVRIPADADTSGKEYIDQVDYAELDDEVAENFWTIHPGAIIVRGLLDDEPIPNEVELRMKYPDVMIVTDFTDNRDRCSDAMKHWRIGGE